MKDSVDTSRTSKLEDENQQLRQAVAELSIINEIATAISSTFTMEKIVDLIVKKCVKHLKVEQTAVMLLDDKGGERPFRTMIRKVDTSGEMLPFRFNEQLTGWMLKNRKPLLINDLPNDDRFQGVAEGTFPINSLLSVPLTLKGRMIGLLTAFNKKMEGEFSHEDQRLLSIIAAQSTQVIENARLYEEEQQLMKMNEQVRLASEIQMGLLPKKSPQIEGYDIAGASYPAQIVGGDYFDFISVDEKQWAICLGDVCGKGLPAALLMANLQATIRGHALIDVSPQLCLQRSNCLLHKSTDSNKFATLFFCILDAGKDRIVYANAGHNRPLYFSSGKEPVFLEKAGIALSFLEKYAYSEETIAFKKDDVLVIYSDGIPEAINDSEEEYGEERFVNCIRRNLTCSSHELIEKIIQYVKNHAGDYPQFDDMTIVVIKRK
jgi:sigma-B regulation protein RsbU (phosphoserine phosphatase)